MKAILCATLCAWACAAVVSAGKGYKYKPCAEYSCCAPDTDEDLSVKFLLEFDDVLPTPFCFSLKRQLELDFVVSYNYLARLNCDKPCFRRATNARIVTPQVFVDCRFPSPPRYDDSDPTNLMIIELDLEQAGQCPTALDGQSTDIHPIHPDVFQNACGHPAWAWDYALHPTKYGPHQCYPDENVACCCACGSDRPLAEDDLLDQYSRSVSVASWSDTLKLVKLTEMEKRRENCPAPTGFSTFVLLEFSGNFNSLEPSQYGDFYGKFKYLLLHSFTVVMGTNVSQNDCMHNFFQMRIPAHSIGLRLKIAIHLVAMRAQGTLRWCQRVPIVAGASCKLLEPMERRPRTVPTDIRLQTASAAGPVQKRSRSLTFDAAPMIFVRPRIFFSCTPGTGIGVLRKQQQGRLKKRYIGSWLVARQTT